MKALGVKIVYYVSPQLWAWRPKRLETIRRTVDRMLVIFPFETAIYEQAGVPVEFVGHPLVDLARATRPRADVLRAAGPRSRPPGARAAARQPARTSCAASCRCWPRAAPLIGARVPGVQFLIARAPSLDDALFEPVGAHACRGTARGRRGRGDRRRAGRGGRRRHGVGHGDRAGGAARHADGDRLPAVGADLRDRQALRSRDSRTGW